MAGPVERLFKKVGRGIDKKISPVVQRVGEIKDNLAGEMQNYKAEQGCHTKAYKFVELVEASKHGRVFGGDQARERLAAMGYSGKDLEQLQRMDPARLLAKVENNLINNYYNPPEE